MKAVQGIVLFALGFASFCNADVIGCSAQKGPYLWNLNPLRRSFEQGDYKVTFNNAAGEPITLNFNLCTNTFSKCTLRTEKKGQYDDDFANIIMADGQCHRLTEDDADDAKVSYLNPNDPEYGLRLKFLSEEHCNDKELYGFTLDIRCDEKAIYPIPRVVTKTLAKNTCQPRIYLDSEAGCASRSFNKVWRFFYNFAEEVGGFLIILGFYLTFFGSRLPKPTLFISGLFAATLTLLVLSYGFILPAFIPDWAHILNFLFTLVFGAAFGILASKTPILGNFVLGAWMGATVGLMIFETAFSIYEIDDPEKSSIVFWSAISMSMAICALITALMSQHGIVIGSAFTGAYCLIRGPAVFIGKFPNEYLVYQRIDNGVDEIKVYFLYQSYQVHDEFYIYLGVYAFLAIVGIILQECLCLRKSCEGSVPKEHAMEGEHHEKFMKEERKDLEEEKPLFQKKQKH